MEAKLINCGRLGGWDIEIHGLAARNKGKDAFTSVFNGIRSGEKWSRFCRKDYILWFHDELLVIY